MQIVSNSVWWDYEQFSFCFIFSFVSLNFSTNYFIICVYKNYIKLFSSLYLCFPFAMVVNSNKEIGIFLLMIFLFLSHYVLVCFHLERSYGSGVEPMALEESLNLPEPLSLYPLHEKSNNNHNNNRTCLSLLCRGTQ